MGSWFDMGPNSCFRVKLQLLVVNLKFPVPKFGEELYTRVTTVLKTKAFATWYELSLFIISEHWHQAGTLYRPSRSCKYKQDLLANN